MRLIAVALVAMLGSTSLASASPLDCQTFLTRNWEGTWEGNVFGETAIFEARASYNEDGSFETKQIVSPADPAKADLPPLVMSAEGTWSSSAGESADSCLLDLEGTAAMGDTTGLSPSDIVVLRVDDDTIRYNDGQLSRVGE